MRKLIKFNLLQVVSWSIVFIGVIFIFTREGTIENWGDNRTKTLLLASLFLFGFGLDFVLRFLEKSKRWGFKRDERDETVQSKAMNVGFLVLAMYIFLLCITLYVVYENDKFLPIGWVWFIAYTTIVIASLSTSITTFILYRKRGF